MRPRSCGTPISPPGPRPAAGSRLHATGRCTRSGSTATTSAASRVALTPPGLRTVSGLPSTGTTRSSRCGGRAAARAPQARAAIRRTRPTDGWQSCGTTRSSPAVRAASAGRSARSLAGLLRLPRRRQLCRGPAGRRRDGRRGARHERHRGGRSVPTRRTSSTWSGCSPRRRRRSACADVLVHAARQMVFAPVADFDLRRFEGRGAARRAGARSSSTGRPRALLRRGGSIVNLSVVGGPAVPASARVRPARRRRWR